MVSAPSSPVIDTHTRKRSIPSDKTGGQAAKKRSTASGHEENQAPKSKRSESISQTLDAVELIIVKLREKHGSSRYSVEKLNCWAHMINMGSGSLMRILQTSL